MKLYLLVLATCVVWTAASGSAALAQTPSLQGNYVLDLQASDDVAKAIDGVVARMPIWKRPFARFRLSRTAEPPQRITISQSSAEIGITMDSNPPTRSPADGTVVDWITPAGEKMRVSTTWEAGRLKRIFEANDGRRVDTFSVNPAGDMLILDVVISGPELPLPLAYKVVFRRRA